MSQKTGFAFRYSTAFAVAIHVKDGNNISSSSFTPNAASERCKAVVQLVTATEFFAPVNLHHLSSNSFTYLPCTTQPDFKGFSIFFNSLSLNTVLAIGIFKLFILSCAFLFFTPLYQSSKSFFQFGSIFKFQIVLRKVSTSDSICYERQSCRLKLNF